MLKNDNFLINDSYIFLVINFKANGRKDIGQLFYLDIFSQ